MHMGLSIFYSFSPLAIALPKTITLRLSKAPPYWRDITSPYGFLSYVQRRDWLLVLSARNIPWFISKLKGHEHIYVPPLMEGLARYELNAFTYENIIHKNNIHYPDHPYALLSSLFLILLIIWHLLRQCHQILPQFIPAPDSWLYLGELDKIRILFYQEYYRIITALTLHADYSHLVGNLLFAAIFLLILSRFIGPGKALFLSILGGAAGNFISLFFHREAYVSIGFSTALFATIGIIGGIMMQRAYDKRNILLAAGGTLGLLALLGTGGEHTDYASHICGLACGLLLGLYEGWREKRHISGFSQLGSAFLALFFPLLSWLIAFDIL